MTDYSIDDPKRKRDELNKETGDNRYVLHVCCDGDGDMIEEPTLRCMKKTEMWEMKDTLKRVENKLDALWKAYNDEG